MTTTNYEWSDIEPLLANLTSFWDLAEITDEIDDDDIDEDYPYADMEIESQIKIDGFACSIITFYDSFGVVSDRQIDINWKMTDESPTKFMLWLKENAKEDYDLLRDELEFEDRVWQEL